MNEEQLDLKAGTRLLVTELRRQWVSLSLALFAALLWTIARLAIPVVIGATIDNAIDLPGGVDFDLLLWFAIGMLGLAALQGGGAAMRRYFAMRTSHRVEADIRMQFYGSISRLSFDFYDRTATGQLMSRASTDVHEVQMLTVMIPINFAFLLMAVGAFAVLAFIHLWLALLGLIVYPMVTLITVRFFNKLFPATARVQQGLGELTSVVEENIAGGRLVRSFGREEHEIAKARKVADQIYDDNMEVARLRTIYGPLFFLLPTIGQLGILAYGGWLALEGQISAGDFVAFFQLLTMLIWPVQGLGEMIASGQRALTSAARIWNIRKEQPTVRQRPHAKSMPDGTGEIEFDHVRFSYIPGQPVLRDFSLKVPAGTSVALVGATASGKSTVAQLLPRFYDIEEGSIKIDGVDVRDLKLQELRSNVGLVFEDTFLFSDTIRNNIAYGNLDATEEEVMKAAQLAHAAEFIERIPEGYDAVVGEQGYSLSGGQRQRIAIARAMLKNAPILLLDEATSALDSETERQVQNALTKLMRGRTTVVIAHRLSTVIAADLIYVLDRGRVVETGTHAELLAAGGAYARLYALQFAAQDAAEPARTASA